MRLRFIPLLPLLLLFVITGCQSEAGESENTSQPETKEWAIALHGGAGYVSKDMPEDRKQAYMESLEEALAIGSDILANGGSALDAIERTVNYLEDNELFNAGKGAVFTSEGKNELDAAIMDGSTLNAGAITGVTTVKNPISLARKVMTESKHVFFATDGAETFADQVDVERVDPSYFYTERRYQSLQRAQEQEKEESSNLLPETNEEKAWKYGTVGAVARDKDGNLAAATSTGGMTNKRYGRVGDVPIIGSGTYANDLVAVSATGWGEKIMLNVSAHTLAAYMEYKETSLQQSMDYLVDEVLEPGDAGFIAVDKYGNFSMKTNTGSMFRAATDSEGNKEIGIWE
ncbi:isoaspartyl peptidase/L-asparaginase family protein [Gracilimonas mengyeensis]|uniref:Isoaspartyl peptidase n=1 Tax=Gracilimonas mengyeensis TaxID=1302730 RepID=A0A521CID8_9BACT|nr:isoaspartyl peptidase/L-asparaginase [Gracilimonas mengyeensis]SMO59216.1 beta-aspartyl-peptidase (threonine type) [Gracilimonas mengyeensis]